MRRMTLALPRKMRFCNPLSAAYEFVSFVYHLFCVLETNPLTELLTVAVVAIKGFRQGAHYILYENVGRSHIPRRHSRRSLSHSERF